MNAITLKLQQQQTFLLGIYRLLKKAMEKYLNEVLEAQIMNKAWHTEPPLPPHPPQYIDMLASLCHAQTGDQL
jgi:hypothetical protein